MLRHSRQAMSQKENKSLEEVGVLTIPIASVDVFHVEAGVWLRLGDTVRREEADPRVVSDDRHAVTSAHRAVHPIVLLDVDSRFKRPTNVYKGGQASRRQALESLHRRGGCVGDELEESCLVPAPVERLGNGRKFR